MEFFGSFFMLFLCLFLIPFFRKMKWEMRWKMNQKRSLWTTLYTPFIYTSLNVAIVIPALNDFDLNNSRFVSFWVLWTWCKFKLGQWCLDLLWPRPKGQAEIWTGLGQNAGPWSEHLLTSRFTNTFTEPANNPRSCVYSSWALTMPYSGLCPRRGGNHRNFKERREKKQAYWLN